MPKLSAGLLLYRFAAGELEVLLVHPGGPYYARKDAGVWSVPKGEYEPEEDPLEVALREFEEELGSPAPVDGGRLFDLGSVTQKGGKIVSVWSAEADFDAAEIRSMTFSIEWPPRSGRLQEFPEVDRAQWWPLAEARLRLNPAQAEFVERLEALVRSG